MLMNQAGTEAGAGGGAQGGQTDQGAGGQAGSQGQGGNPPPTGGLEFIPETYRNDPTFSKYKNPDEFFKGVKNMAELVGKKHVVQGLELPSDNATPEELSEFYGKLGRPETADKYEFSPDLKMNEGFDFEAEKKGFSELAHKAGLTKKQAADLFKGYVEVVNAKNPVKSLEEAKKEAFGDQAEARFDLAKKGADAHGLTDKLNAAGYGRDPLFLQVLALLGETVGEGDLKRGGSGENHKSLLEEAHRLQRSALYQKHDPATVRRVEEIYATVYPDKG